MVRLVEMHARHTSGTVGARGGNRGVIGANARVPEDERLGFVEERAIDQTVVHHDESQSRRAVVEHERPNYG